MPIPQTIAVDGPAASGKSTIAELLAQSLGYLYFDTGVMYRAVTLAALRQLQAVTDERAVTHLAETVHIDVREASQDDGRKSDVLLDGVDITWEIRAPEVDANVSVVSAYPGVRVAMTEQQRRIGKRGRVVMVGRDIGTVVLPDADLKVYMDASVEERARRRFDEVRQRGEAADYEAILASMRRRDEIDSTRKVAPLRPADDAVIVSTDGLSIEQVLEKIQALVKAR
ncbi:(d)CMP kinase [Levilinea saccharolytica]|uniref:Cytidylate kinase n=1 Tax=Levilinea saccharolytica TaxID=229921 RepID=A0A0P6Z381_9CHLR|nr:(d)CMP kinase [Levilinea saccharolytica]KPL91841.1 cytidylate kinase [Levilinea saccharolytica]GAP17664.1 cytidylate kinase [Levilinea saccharolytica]